MIPSVVDYSDEVSRAMLDHRFGPSGVPDLKPDQVARIRELRNGARLFARHVLAACPPSWERDECLKDIDNACSWASRAVARNE